MTHAHLNKTKNKSPYSVMYNPTGELLPPKEYPESFKLIGRKGRLVQKSIKDLIDNFTKTEMKIILNMTDDVNITQYNILKHSFKIYTQNMKTSNRSTLKKKMIQNHIIIEHNKHIMLSPFLLIPNSREPYDAGAIVQYIWLYLTGSTKWKELRSGFIFKMFSLKHKIFYETEPILYDKKPEDNKELEDGFIYVERKATLPNKEIITYSEYMASDEWKTVRNKRLALDNYKCVNCGSDIQMECHHTDYQNLGNESMDQLQSLCSVCHYKIHQQG